MADAHTSAENRPEPVSVSMKPSWVRIPDAIKLFGLGRTTLYELIAEGKIKSASIRPRGSLRGLRIISTDSLEDYCQRLATDGKVSPAQSVN